MDYENGGAIAKGAGIVPYIDDYKERTKKGEKPRTAFTRTVTSYTLHEVVADNLPAISSDIGVAIAFCTGNPEFSTGVAYAGTAVGVGLSIGVNWVTDNTIDSDIQE